MTWQNEPHERRMKTFAQRTVSAVVFFLTLTLLALAADNFARCAAIRIGVGR